MSLFLSPAFRVFNSENSESSVQRKPGGSTLLLRKPFLDKTVNALTPDNTIKVPVKAYPDRKTQCKPEGGASLSRKLFLDKTANTLTPDVNTIKMPVKAYPDGKTHNLDIHTDDYFSYKEMEDRYEDLIPHAKRLESHDVYNILKNYLNDSTPPPSPTSVKLPFDEPMLANSLDSSFSSNKSFDEDMFFELPEKHDFLMKSVDEIDLPVFDIDDV